MSDGYRLARREQSGAVLGFTLPQVLLLAVAVIAAIGAPRTLGAPYGLALGTMSGAFCGWLALWPVAGRPAYAMVPVLVRFAAVRAFGRTSWYAPLPLLSLLTGSPAPPDASATRRRSPTPPCLAGLVLHAAPRPDTRDLPGGHDWAGAGTTLAPVALVRDARSGTVTVVLDARGGPFSLLDAPGQHARMSDWGRVLAQFARETSPVTRLAWSLWSAPTPLSDHVERLRGMHESRQGAPTPDAATAKVLDAYERLLDDASATTYRHELRLSITIDPARLAVRDPDAVAAAALAAARALADRCSAAGLLISGVLSPVQIAEAIRVRADPAVATTLAGVRKGLVELAGLAAPTLATLGSVDAVHALPMAVERRWDAVRIDGAWHRGFWIAQWPRRILDPRWLEPLLLAPPCVRTLTVSYEPISARTSRRRLTAESVSVESQLQTRDKHGLRAGVELRRAQADVDQREAELISGHTEYGFVGLICVTGSDPADLDTACHALLDQAARSGLMELRPLHGRHDAAWACTLPLGRAPDRELLRTP